MQTPEPRLTCIQTAPEPGEVYVAECGMFDFEIRATGNMGYRLRMWEIRPEDSPILFWESDGCSLEGAKARIRLARQLVGLDPDTGELKEKQPEPRQ